MKRILHKIPERLRGPALYATAAVMFSLVIIDIRLVTEHMNPLQVVFFRNLFAVMFMLPWILKGGGSIFKTNRLGKHLVRASLGLVAMYLWFFAVSVLPLADAVSLNFTVPIFATIGAVLFLREKVGYHRWGATLFGFFGVMVILRPGFTEISPLMSLPIIAAIFMASTALLVKSLSRTESTVTIMAYMNVLLTPLSLLPALYMWQWPTWEVLGLLVLLGGLVCMAHYVFTQSYKYADASALMPYEYLRLPIVSIMAFFLFGETSDMWTWIGAGIIALSTIYITHREAKNRTGKKVISEAPTNSG